LEGLERGFGAVCGLHKNDLSSDGKLVFQITAQIVFIFYTAAYADPKKVAVPSEDTI
jgi:hypothetical protein